MPKDMEDFEDVKKAVGEVKTLFEEFKKSNDEQIKEVAKGFIDPLLEERLTKINGDLAEKQETIDKMYASMRRKTTFLDGKEIDRDALDMKAQDWANVIARQQGRQAGEFKHDEAMAYKAAFERYLRKDDRVLSADEQKALSVGSDPDGGYTVAPDLSGRIVQKVFETSPIRQYAAVQVISTSSLGGTYDLEEAASGWVNETEARTETATPQLGAWDIPVHEQYAEPKATQKILDDSAIDMEAWLAGKVSSLFIRKENTAFVTGDGVGKPRGITTYADGTTLPGTVEQFSTGVNGDFAATPDGGDKLLDMIYGTKTAYRANGVFFMNSLTLGGLRKLKDSNGAMIWQPSAQAGQPSSLFGYPVATFEDMADYTTTGALAIAFADMSEAYQIVDRLGIRVLRDPYTAKPYIKFYTTKRVGGDVLNFEAIKLLKFAV